MTSKVTYTRWAVRDARVHFVFQPIFGNFLLHDFHVPGVAGTEVAASASKSEATLRAIRAEGAIRSADRAALAEGNHVVRFLHGLRLCLFLAWRWSWEPAWSW